MTKVAALLVVVSGCYFYYPDLPKTTVKPVEGATIELKTRDHTDWYTCGESDKDCEVHDGKLKRADRYVILSANYEGKKLSQADFRALADPEYPKRLQQIEAKKGTCRLSLVPSVIAAIGILAETVVLAGSSQFGDSTLPLALISGGAALGGAALSYPLGGYACREAGKLAEPLHLDYGDEIYVRPDRTALAEEMTSLTDAFNARFHGPAAPDPTETPGTDAPEPDTTGDAADRQPKRGPHVHKVEPTAAQPPPAIASRARDALLATGKFPSFVAAIDNAKAWDRFETSTYTIFAPTEDAFAALPEKDRTYLLTTRSGMVAVVWGNHVVYQKLTRAQIAKEPRLDTHGSQREPIKKTGKALLIDGAVIGEPLDTPDGVIYPIDKVLQ